jgi:DNA-binding transcriptional LysR family regulator
MDNLHWELSVLSRAIHYKNLSGASVHVGLSQPQLSRIVSRLEQDLGLILLDRTARRKSGWAPIAYKIADTYFRSSRKLTQDLQQLKADGNLTQISIGILEGLTPLASEFCYRLFGQTHMQMIELNVFDLSELEERFEREEVDLILTCREPGKHKYRYIKNLGFQALSRTGSGGGAQVFSQFEYANFMQKSLTKSTKKAKGAPILVSNSLAIRKQWIEERQGSGFVPSEVRNKKNAETDLPVILIGSDMLNPAIWERFEDCLP